MPRDLRFIPPNSLVEVTCRTLHGRFLLKPHPNLNPIIIGVLAKAQKRYGMTVCAFVYPSNHCHLLLQPEDAWQLARFMNYVNSNIAKEAGRLYHWRQKFWERRYRPIVVSNEPEIERQRHHYLYSQGCKEGLVDSSKSWPGATSAKAKNNRLQDPQLNPENLQLTVLHRMSSARAETRTSCPRETGGTAHRVADTRSAAASSTRSACSCP